MRKLNVGCIFSSSQLTGKLEKKQTSKPDMEYFISGFMLSLEAYLEHGFKPSVRGIIYPKFVQGIHNWEILL